MKLFYIGCCIGSVLTVIARYLPLKQEARPSCSDDRTSHPAQASFFSLIPLCYRDVPCQKNGYFVHGLSALIYGCVFVFSLQQETLMLKCLLLCWLTMAFSLSMTDLFYFIVEPKLLYPFGFLLWLLHFYFQSPFYWYTGVFVLFCLFIVTFFFQSYLGLGDVLLLLIWGPWLSLYELFLLLAIASCLALVFFCLYFLVKKKQIGYLPFVPFLSLGLWYLLT